MHKYCCSLYLLLQFGLFSFSEGKPCPERSRPHKTRCDVFYKCTELSADKHVWVPTRCDEGLVYEHSLTVCVLPADDWECSLDDHKTNVNPNKNNNNRDGNPNADIYIVSNAEDGNISLNSKYEDGKVEIVIGPDMSDEDKDEESVYDGSGNGGESVELDGFMPAQNREDEPENIPVLTKEENHQVVAANTNLKAEQRKETLADMLQTIKTKADIGQPSTNIDPNLTAHLQRLSQLIDGLKQTYQKAEVKPQDGQDLRPDQLNAFLAHFKIKNKFDSLDPKDSFVAGSTKAAAKDNRTSFYKQELSAKLNPETKVILSHTLPHRYSDNSNESAHPSYSNSQIVVNRPAGAIHFSLPERHYFEHADYPAADKTPKISEETLKTVLELSKQMIAQQNVPKVISSPAYYAPPIMQPILLTPHADSPFSTNYGSQGSAFKGHYDNSNKPSGKRPQYFEGNKAYDVDNNAIYEDSKGNDYRDSKPGTTIIHNNIIPLQASNKNSGEKEVLDSYGQSLAVYPPIHTESHDSNLEYHSDSNAISGYSPGYPNNEFSVLTTKRPYVGVSATSSPLAITARPFEYHPSTNTIDQYFTPSQHLGNHNVNNVFPAVDNYGSSSTSIHGITSNSQDYKPFPESAENQNIFDAQNQLFPQVNSNNIEVRPNSHSYGSFENNKGYLTNNYNNHDEESQLVAYTFGNKKKPGQQNMLSNYGEPASPSNSDSVFSTDNHYIARPNSNSLGSESYPNSYYTLGKNKFTTNSLPILPAYGEGNQLVNVGGNFIGFDVFRNSILPLLGNNPAVISAPLNNIEVITCAAGVRQPNATDCTRYYVCSKKDGRVLSYSCPPYTAFNSEARICDAKTYALCSNVPIIPTYSISENKRMQMEALKAIQEAKRRQQQQQALKAHNMANILQQYGFSASSSNNNNPFSSSASTRPQSPELNMLNSYMQQAAAMSQSIATTPRPQLATPTAKKRKYYCKEGDKIADQTSIDNYFVCYKNSKGQMKGHKMTCSKGLLFCPKSTVCTLPSKCS